jgi:signal transduction histidine kinase
MNESDRRLFLAVVEDLATRLAERRVAPPAEVRRKARALAGVLSDSGVHPAEGPARSLAEIGADDSVDRIMPLLKSYSPQVLVGYLQENTYLHRNVVAIQRAIKQLQRIVGALKSYSHLDQAKIEPADLHEGIENTLVILHHELKHGISVVRKYGLIPRVPVYIDELNQVWTNLIHNAVQALGGKGEIVIETAPPSEGPEGPEGSDRESMVSVRVMDNGPGIPPEILPRIFEPFFTTKAKGEGTGLGLGIVKKIVDKHGGRVEVTSEPGRTVFTVKLPVVGTQTQSVAS